MAALLDIGYFTCMMVLVGRMKLWETEYLLDVCFTESSTVNFALYSVSIQCPACSVLWN